MHINRRVLRYPGGRLTVLQARFFFQMHVGTEK
jgi:hypothetical protein